MLRPQINSSLQELEATIVKTGLKKCPIAIAGIFSSEVINEIQQQFIHIDKSAEFPRYISYHDCRRLVEKLADKLKQNVEAKVLKRCKFVPVPRGGLIVLGMLAYELGLHPEQLAGAETDESQLPQVLVDDIILTGRRVGDYLQRYSNKRFHVASLFSHPELRSSMIKAEKNVISVLAGEDLTERTKDRTLPDVTKRIKNQLPAPRYWVGNSDYVFFAWNQPERFRLNKETGEIVKAWNFLPFKQAKKKNTLNSRVTVIDMQQASGTHRLSEDIVHCQIGNAVCLMNLSTDKQYVLEDSAAYMWQSMLAFSDTQEAVQRLRELYPDAQSNIDKDYESFIEKLKRQGLVTQKHSAPLGSDAGQK